MNQTELLARIEKTFDECLEICRKKNSDYATDQDAFKNLRTPELIGISATRGILVRVLDKLTRMSNLLDRPPEVADEGIRDTAKDIAVYMALFIALLDDAK